MVGREPQQILAHIAKPTGDALVDNEGHAHPLEASTMIGRTLERSGILILDASVSLHHALLSRVDDAWHVRDLGSANGTFVNGTRITEATVLRHGDALAIGAVSFVLACQVGALADVPLDPSGVETLEIVRAVSLSPIPL